MLLAWYSYFLYVAIFVIQKTKIAKNLLDKKTLAIGIPTTTFTL